MPSARPQADADRFLLTSFSPLLVTFERSSKNSNESCAVERLTRVASGGFPNASPASGDPSELKQTQAELQTAKRDLAVLQDTIQ